MQIIKIIFLCVVLFENLQLNSMALYGVDDRRPIQKASKIYQHLSRSIPAMIHKKHLSEKKDHYILSNFTLKDKYSNLPDHEDVNRQAVATCSGFLFEQNTIFTAGHCMDLPRACEDYYWVFDYRDGVKKFPKKNVYRCKKITEYYNLPYQGVDFAKIRLKRNVKNREVLLFRPDEDLIEDGSELFMIGYPLGLPATLTTSGYIIDNSSENFFYSNLDAFEGNSGSPVFNRETFLVEGILIKGNKDFFEKDGLQKYFHIDEFNTSYHSKNLKRGEKVMRINL